MNNYPFLGTNSLLSNVLKILIDCSNNFKISIYSDASGINFAADSSGNKINNKFVCSENYIPDEYINITFNDNNYIKMSETDKYWCTICANRDILDNFDLSYCSPITEINVSTLGKEINIIFGVNTDASGNSFEYDKINNKIANFINIYTDSYGIDFANDNNNLAIENRYLKNITHYPSENCEVNSAIITFGNNSTFTLLDYNKHWYKAGIYTRIVFDSSATPISYPFVQYSDNEKLFSILTKLINQDNRILISICYDSLGNNYVKNNDNSLIYNRYILNVYYTPGIIHQVNGYLTITFGNQSTFTIIDDVDKYFYNIKIK